MGALLELGQIAQYGLFNADAQADYESTIVAGRIGGGITLLRKCCRG
jgi:hypothetical protein